MGGIADLQSLIEKRGLWVQKGLKKGKPEPGAKLLLYFLSNTFGLVGDKPRLPVQVIEEVVRRGGSQFERVFSLLHIGVLADIVDRLF